MLDIRLIREDAGRVASALARRGADYSGDVARVSELDARRRALLQEIEGGKAEQNAASKQIPLIKKAGGDVSELMSRMKDIAARVGEGEAELRAVGDELNSLLLRLPNMPDPSVPDGRDGDDNVETRRWGRPREFDFEPKAHWAIGEALGILDPARAAKVTGARFHFYKGMGARLERAVINFFLDSHAAAGYTEIFPPFLVNRASMTGTGQLPKFEEDAFAVRDTDYFLAPTAEVPVTNLHRDEILTGLPISYCAYSACFRAEAGSAGRDTRGLIRQHQFNKIELVKFTAPDDSRAQLERLTADAESVLRALELPYRTVCLCAGDLGSSSAKTYDLEVWMPSYGRYVEISSCSNFKDYQARRAGIRFRSEAGGSAKAGCEYVHTLNGSGVAAGRTTAAILENFQRADGGVDIPRALSPYLGGASEIIKNY
ncbi:MAG: serine--tRNA ligase [Oscillospiraceae bacterium]|nr:serine--tRNA ligase [Oscillospiraceae bacterium]